MKIITESVRIGPMDMRQFLDTNTAEEIRRVADEAGTKVIYLRQIGCGAKRPSPVLARRIEQASLGSVPAAELRPDVFGPMDPLPRTEAL